MSNYYSLNRTEILQLLPKKFESVIEFGCATGQTLKSIKQSNPSVHTTGVEIDPLIAAIAATNVDQVITLDIERDFERLATVVGTADVLLLLDILEHLVSPWDFLDRARSLLNPDGTLIASVPNVRNFKVTLPLILTGRWDYQGAGILDRTHLRFFTKSSVLDIFSQTGWEVIRIERTGPITFSAVKSVKGALALALNKLSFGLFKEFITHQYLIVAVTAEDNSADGEFAE